MVDQELINSGYEDLANAIIIRAILDYWALNNSNKKPDKYMNNEELEEFFRSDWYDTLTSIDVDYLLMKGVQNYGL